MRIEGEKAYFRRAFAASQSHEFVVFHTEGDRPENSYAGRSDTTFKMIKQGLHDEQLTRSSSCFRTEEAVPGRVLGLLKLLLIAFSGDERTKRVGEAPVLQTQKEFYLPNHFPH